MADDDDLVGKAAITLAVAARSMAGQIAVREDVGTAAWIIAAMALERLRHEAYAADGSSARRLEPQIARMTSRLRAHGAAVRTERARGAAIIVGALTAPKVPDEAIGAERA